LQPVQAVAAVVVEVAVAVVVVELNETLCNYLSLKPN
jgi:hypothetical protein